jgi:hypothetical protein
VAAGVTVRVSVPALAATIVAGLLVAGCGTGPAIDRPATLPPTTFGPGEATGAEVAATRAELARVLGAVGLQLADAQVPHRPGESALFAAAPRAVYQVVLPDDPTHGFISVYEFADEAAATAAGNEQAAYVASGPGRVQFPPDSRFVLRQLGPTVVFFAWSPANSPDERTPEVQRALETIGTAIAIPS